MHQAKRPSFYNLPPRHQTPQLSNEVVVRPAEEGHAQLQRSPRALVKDATSNRQPRRSLYAGARVVRRESYVRPAICGGDEHGGATCHAIAQTADEGVQHAGGANVVPTISASGNEKTEVQLDSATTKGGPCKSQGSGIPALFESFAEGGVPPHGFGEIDETDVHAMLSTVSSAAPFTDEATGVHDVESFGTVEVTDGVGCLGEDDSRVHEQSQLCGRDCPASSFQELSATESTTPSQSLAEATFTNSSQEGRSKKELTAWVRLSGGQRWVDTLDESEEDSGENREGDVADQGEDDQGA